MSTPHGSRPDRWALRLDPAHLAAIGRIRLLPGIEVCRGGDGVWLRGERADEATDRRLRSVPGARRFRVLADGQLVASGELVPRGRLPDGPWVPLVRWLGAEMPRSVAGAELDHRVALVLCRTSRFEEPAVLLTTLDHWSGMADEAAEVRLQQWRFAVCADGRVVVWGRALPALPGQRWVERDSIAVPAGWAWSPAVEPAVLRQAFDLLPGDLALWHPDGSWERIAAGDFVRATRAAIRASTEGARHG